eukprot:2361177-Pleurochrysis_carterae.AAC.1
MKARGTSIREGRKGRKRVETHRCRRERLLLLEPRVPQLRVCGPLAPEEIEEEDCQQVDADDRGVVPA